MIEDNERLRDLFKERSTVSQREFGKLYGIGTGSMVSQYINGFRPLNLQAAIKFSKGLGVPIEAFSPSLARLAMSGAENVQAVPRTEPGRVVPVISWVQCGLPSDCGQPDYDDTVRTTVDCGPRAYALRIRGDSMAPDFLPGDIVIIDEDIFPVPGDFVAARIESSSETTFKRYALRGVTPDGRDIFDLVPINPLYPTLRSDAVGASVIGTMIEHRRFRRTR